MSTCRSFLRAAFPVLASTVFDDTEDALDAFLAEQFPGAHETGFSDITIRLTLPGPIVESNADEVEVSTAQWTVNIWDALARPLEIRARAVLTN